MRLFVYLSAISLFSVSSAFADVNASLKRSYSCSLMGRYFPDSDKSTVKFLDEKVVVEIETPVFTKDQLIPKTGGCTPKRNAVTMDLQGIIFELGVYVCYDPVPYFVLNTESIPGYKFYDNVLPRAGEEVVLKIGWVKEGGMRIRDGFADDALQLVCTSPSQG